MAIMAIERMRLMPKNRNYRNLIEAGFFASELYFCVPLGLAAYPQYGEIGLDELEEEFKDVRGKNGLPIK
jgi:hypothetical protein